MNMARLSNPTRLGLSILLSCFVVPATGLPAAADPAPIGVRYGEHAGFGRIVFDTDDGAGVSVDREGDVLRVKLGGAALLPDGRPPHNVLGISTGSAAVVIELAAKAGVRHLVVDGHLVVDVLDPILPAPGLHSAQIAVEIAPPRLPLGIRRSVHEIRPPTADAVSQMPSEHGEPPKTEPAGSKVGPAYLVSATAPIPARLTERPTTAAELPQPLDGHAKSPPSAIAAVVVERLDPGPGHQLAVPFAPQVGAAAYRRGGEAVVVFDERKPIDLQGLKDDPVFGSATVQLLPTATILRLRLPILAELRLKRSNGSWIVTAIGGDAIPSVLRPIAPAVSDKRVLLPAAQPGSVLSVPDPATGGVLLVGTQRDAGEGVAVARRAPDFILIPTWQGVVVEAVSDNLTLRAVTTGFALTTDGASSLTASSNADPAAALAAEAGRLTRIFDFPALPTDALMNRLQGAIVVASSTPTQTRASARKAVAESMIALGLGSEAQAVLKLASIGDARSQDDPSLLGLSAIAGLLSGRADEAASLDEHALDGTDEIAFWRAVRAAQRTEGSPEAAQVFANTVALPQSYPAELRRRLLPIVAETMAVGGQVDAARRLLEQQKANPDLDLARALLAPGSEAERVAALSRMDGLAAGSDRLVRVRAARAAVELRLAEKLITPAQAAETLGKLLFAWRGDEREIELRLRVADLLGQAGEWRDALQLLRETQDGWPDHEKILSDRLRATFEQALQPPAIAHLRPFDLVSLAGENADLLPAGEAGQRLAEQISKQLLALDLPGRAGPLLEKMLKDVAPGVARATLGAELASLRLQQADVGGALDALKMTAFAGLPIPLVESRTVTLAKTLGLKRDFTGARDALVQLDSEAGDRALVDVAEVGKNLPLALEAWQRSASRLVPRSGPLDEAQGRVLLRLAGAASAAGDNSVLTGLRTQDVARVVGGKTADLLRLLTSQPVEAVGDLPRGGKEMMLAHSVQAALSPVASR